MRLALRQERSLHLQGLAERAGKLLQARNTGEAHRLVLKLRGVTRGGTLLALRTSTRALVFDSDTIPHIHNECYQPCGGGPPANP